MASMLSKHPRQLHYNPISKQSLFYILTSSASFMTGLTVYFFSLPHPDTNLYSTPHSRQILVPEALQQSLIGDGRLNFDVLYVDA